MIRSKLTPSPPAAQSLARPHLCFAAAADPQLILLCAPAGYGKTTAMAAEYLTERRNGATVAWLTLDEDDGDSEQFLRELAASLDAAGIGAARPESGPGKSAGRACVPVLLNRIGSCPGRVTLFLDDLHRSLSPAVDHVLRLLVERAPDNLRFVIATRRQLSLPLARLQASGRLASIGVNELRFRESEAIAYLAECANADRARLLAQRTEGWPVMLGLARSWLARTRAPGEALETFSGSTGEFARYLAEQVLSSLPADLQRTLLEIALFERINGDLLNAVADCGDGWERLEQIAASCPLVQQSDDERQWFRVHALFAEFLRQRLGRLEAQRIPAIHRAAARWFARSCLLLEAVRHAVQSEDAAFAAGIIEQAGGWRLAMQGGTAILKRFCRFEADVASCFPQIRLGQIYLMIQEGSVAEARAALNALKRRTGNFGEDQHGHLRGPLTIDGRLLDLAVRLYEDRAISSAEITGLEERIHEQGLAGASLLASTGTLACFVAYDEGDYERCLLVGRQVIERCRALDGAFFENYLRLHLGLAQLALGRLAEAEAEFRQVMADAASAPNPATSQEAAAVLFLAEVQLERGCLASAEELVQRGLPQIQRAAGWLDVYASGHLTRAAIAARHRDIDGSLSALREAQSMARNLDMPRLEALAQIQGVWALARARRVGEARSWSHEPCFQAAMRLTSALGRNHRLRDVAHLAYARLLLEEGDADQALTLLRPLVPALEARRASRLLASALTLTALACEQARLGEPRRSALRALRKLVRPYGLYQRVADDAPQIAALLNSASQEDAPGARMGNRLLSMREAEILAHLAEGRTNKDIASRLRIAEGTVRTYRKSLYRKLKASSRARVIAAAREHALI